MTNSKDKIADFTVSKEGNVRFTLSSCVPAQTAAHRNSHLTQELTDSERIDLAAARVLARYRKAFEELEK